ncbi:MAG: 4Fe-4S binding protein [Atopobiaceae bacterium]|nr:4Fe-4S binding protein [Atopobiaceae bacterium]
MRIKILRQQTPFSKPYWEAFAYNGTKDISVAGLLDHLNYHDDIMNDAGEPTTRIGWECSCLQGVCGGCAMVINDMPALACETFLRDLEGTEIELRPLRKFPVIHDLIVDRSSIQENLKRTDIYIGEYQPKKGEDSRRQYDVAKCLKCGLCLEVCPNYTCGETFFGAVFANDCYLVAARNRTKAKDIHRAYAAHFGNACSKSFACMDVCPADIPTIASMSRLNR